MNSSTLRRLAADQASLHTSELPPHYFFPSTESSIPDDLTQLTILLTGPQGTPYSQGVWKLWLKIPEDFPRSPPKACFRTRIWHPNVEENTGSVCVDTLKKDWVPKLTLRDVLITISCLLIQPNPDSALNATAGHLLQDDYEQFARHAKLMTSIHANIPAGLEEAASAARRRGEAPGTATKEETDQRPTLRGKSASSSSVVMKKLPQRLIAIPQAPPSQGVSLDAESDGEEDEASASKENDPALSPEPIPTQSPRRPNLAKRPLSDLPCPTEDELDQKCTSPSEQNIANNTPRIPAEVSTGVTCPGSQLSERDQLVNSTGRSFKDANAHATVSIQNEMDAVGRPAKRICSDEAKENTVAEYGLPLEAKPCSSSSSVKLSVVPPKVQPTGARKASAPGSLGAGGVKGGKARIGLRRL